jgi:hypothetical protein
VRLHGIIIFSFLIQTFATKNFEKMDKEESVNYVMNCKHHATLCLADWRRRGGNVCFFV